MTNSRKTYNHVYTPIRRWIFRMRSNREISLFVLQPTIYKDKLTFCKKETNKYYEMGVNYKSRGSLSKLRKFYWTDFWGFYGGVRYNYLKEYDKG